jgi:flavodoxin I
MLKLKPTATVTLLLFSYICDAYIAVVPAISKKSLQHQGLFATVGIFFGTSVRSAFAVLLAVCNGQFYIDYSLLLKTGHTEDCAATLHNTLKSKAIDVVDPIDVGTLKAGSLQNAFAEHDVLIVGTPTWNTDADTHRSGTAWDDLYYDKLPELKSVLNGKKVAVFGVGDQASYGDYFIDATGELYSVFEGLGCSMVLYAHTSQDASKSIVPGTDLFCGLALDQINQEDLTEARVAGWIEKLTLGGFFDSAKK